MSSTELDLPLLPSAEQIRRREFATIRCLPFDQPEDKGSCVVCGKAATAQAVFSRAY